MHRLAVILLALIFSAGLLPAFGLAQAEEKLAAAEIQQFGRAERVPEGWRVTWPGVAWRTAFSGDAIGVVAKDPGFYYAVIVDGRHLTPFAPTQTEDTAWFRDLGPGRHVIDVVRMGSSASSSGLFVGFKLGSGKLGTELGRWLSPPPLPSRAVEVLGDSSATGYGNLSAKTECTRPEMISGSDASQSFGVFLAQRLNARWQINVMNGMGIARNYDGSRKGTPFSAFYARKLQNDPASVYEDQAWRPDVVVIALGTNDFSTPLKPDEPLTAELLESAFEQGYRNLVAQLRRAYGRDTLIVAIRPRYGVSNVERVVSGLLADGDARITLFTLPDLQATGCDYHPTAADHALIAAALDHAIKDFNAARPSGS